MEELCVLRRGSLPIAHCKAPEPGVQAAHGVLCFMFAAGIAVSRLLCVLLVHDSCCVMQHAVE